MAFTEQLKLIFSLSNTRVNELRSKQLQTATQAFLGAAHEDHSTKSFFITLVFPSKDVDAAWRAMPHYLDKIEELSREVLCAFTVVGVEMHRQKHLRKAAAKPKVPKRGRPKLKDLLAREAPKPVAFADWAISASAEAEQEIADKVASGEMEASEVNRVLGQAAEPTLQYDKKGEPILNAPSKEGPNKTQRGFPHMHVFLTVYNDFMAPSIAKIELMLLELGFIDIDVKLVPYGNDEKRNFDAKKMFLYTVKEGKDTKFQKFYRNLSDTNCVRVYYGHPEFESRMTMVLSLLERSGVAIDKHWLIVQRPLPSVGRSPSQQVQITEFVGNVMKMGDLRIKPGSRELFKRQLGAKYTWTPTKVTLNGAYSALWKQIPGINDRLLNSSSWVLKKLEDLQLDILPQVHLDAQQVELQNGVYDFKTGTFVEFYMSRSGGNTSCCSYWPNEVFTDLTFPMYILKHLKRTIPYRKVYEYLEALGSVFHDQSVPARPCSYIHGLTGTAKTTLTDLLLAMIFSEHLIGRIAPYTSRFQLTDLLGVWVAILNDFSISTSYNHQSMTNLLEGNQVIIDQKYQQPIKTRIERVIITSNEDPHQVGAQLMAQEEALAEAAGNEDFVAVDKLAPLIRRLNIFEFIKPPNRNYSLEAQRNFANFVKREALGFAVLANLVFLHETGFYVKGSPPNIPASWLCELRDCGLALKGLNRGGVERVQCEAKREADLIALEEAKEAHRVAQEARRLTKLEAKRERERLASEEAEQRCEAAIEAEVSNPPAPKRAFYFLSEETRTKVVNDIIDYELKAYEAALARWERALYLDSPYDNELKVTEAFIDQEWFNWTESNPDRTFNSEARRMFRLKRWTEQMHRLRSNIIHKHFRLQTDSENP